MWDHYRKSFWSMQVMILGITCAVFVMARQLWLVAALFFVVMQLGSVIGALWATRLRRKLERPPW
jgi:hypothetical protein